MNDREREILVLRYLSALEQGDVDMLADIMTQAETDPALESMIREVHTALPEPVSVTHQPSANGSAKPRLFEVNTAALIPNQYSLQGKGDISSLPITTTDQEETMIAAQTQSLPFIRIPWTLITTAAMIALVAAVLIINPLPSPDSSSSLSSPPPPSATAPQQDGGDEYVDTEHEELEMNVVGNVVTLVVDGWVGNITITEGAPESNVIKVDVTKYASAASQLRVDEELAAMSVSATDHDGKQYVEVDYNGPSRNLDFTQRSVDLIIEVPYISTLEIEHEIGDITIENIRPNPLLSSVGAISIDLEVGDVFAKNIGFPYMVSATIDAGNLEIEDADNLWSLDADIDTGDVIINDTAINSTFSEIKVNTGSVKMDQVSTGVGFLRVTVQTGDVIVRQSEAWDARTEISVDLGNIHFNATVTEETKTFEVEMGDIDIEPTPTSKFKFTASVNIGAIDVRGLDGAVERNDMGATAEGGNAPNRDDAATFILSVDMGAIDIHD
jgi:hypothetical protein